ncbi:MAG: glucosamine-6-phosphate deaminase [Chloroflexota bacterium]
MKLIVTDDYEALSTRAAGVVIEYILQNPASVLVFATGRSPLGMFTKLVSAYQRGEVSFKNCSLVELDDYFNISQDDHRNLYNWLAAEFISQVDILAKNIVRFNTASTNPEQECARVEQAIANLGGIDLLVLGLGPNGHLGFNEPGSDFESPTRVITLSAASIKSSAQYWGKEEDVPRQGITLGLKTLSGASHTLLLVSGVQKAEIFKATFKGPITTGIPATILQQYQNLTVIADKAVAADISITSALSS